MRESTSLGWIGEWNLLYDNKLRFDACRNIEDKDIAYPQGHVCSRPQITVNSTKVWKSLIWGGRVGSVKSIEVRVCVRPKCLGISWSKPDFKDLWARISRAFCKQRCPKSSLARPWCLHFLFWSTSKISGKDFIEAFMKLLQVWCKFETWTVQGQP